MEFDRRITLNNGAKDTYVSIGSQLVRMFELNYGEVRKIVEKINPKAKVEPDESSFRIKPPIPEARLDDLGGALVELAKGIGKIGESDPSPPYYCIHPPKAG